MTVKIPEFRKLLNGSKVINGQQCGRVELMLFRLIGLSLYLPFCVTFLCHSSLFWLLCRVYIILFFRFPSLLFVDSYFYLCLLLFYECLLCLVIPLVISSFSNAFSRQSCFLVSTSFITPLHTPDIPHKLYCIAKSSFITLQLARHDFSSLCCRYLINSSSFIA